MYGGFKSLFSYTPYLKQVIRNSSTEIMSSPKHLEASSIESYTTRFLDFVNGSPTPFHAVHNCKNRLTEFGFQEIKEKDAWKGKLKPSGKYFFTRNQSSIVAFAVGANFKPGNGFSIVAAHTDSPCLKVKPVSKKEAYGYLQVGVQLYGGGIWHTWFDRDLSIAGRVIVSSSNGGLESHLVRINNPILRIPSLAIHLDRTVNESFTFNSETKLLPILATISQNLNGTKKETNSELSENNIPITSAHHPELLSVLSEQLNVQSEQIVDLELCLYDTQPSCLGGLKNEFIYSPRLDNLMMSYCALESLVGSLDKHDLGSESNVRMICLYDNEEVGSTSAYGADSHLTEATLRRIQSAFSSDNSTTFEESIHNSYLISADMAHAVHPNYGEIHESNHRPKLHGGVVIKVNANQRYATTAATSAILKRIAAQHHLPLQEFVVRNDCPCGSTIGPILSAKLGLQTIDVGCPQLSMHSIREVAGKTDLAHAIKLFEEFYGSLPNLLENMKLD